MKSYICGIWLLMYMVLVPSTTKADQAYNMHLDYCKWGHEHLTVGYHTAHPCIQLYCDGESSIVTLNQCPELICDPDETVLFRSQDESKKYPDCCPRPFCANSHPTRKYF